MRSSSSCALAILALLAPPLATTARADDPPTSTARESERYVAVVPPALRAAVKPLLSHRKAEGLDVELVDPSGQTAQALRRAILERRPRYVLLVGDVDLVPAFEVSEATTDRPYGDADDDGLPEASVGRIPSSEPGAVGRVVAATLAYETKPDAGAWRKQCSLVAGEGRFGAAADKLIENMFQRVVSKNIPLAYDVDLTYANATSPFCYPPERFADRVVSRVNEGALVVAYVGHGAERSVDELTAPGPNGKVTSYDVLDASRVPSIDSRGAPIMVAIACWTGRYEAQRPCIGEELLLTGKGPVAFLGATRISHPICNAVLAIGLVGQLFGDAERLGPAVDAAEKSLVVDNGDPIRREIVTMSMMFMPVEELKAEMPRHVDMYNLLGDPALRLRRPSREGTLEAALDDGAVVVRGSIPAGGSTATVTLEVERERMARPTAPANETPLERYARANDRVLATAVVRVTDGRFEARLKLPAGLLPRTHVVKAFVTGSGDACAALATTVDLKGVAPVEPTPAEPPGEPTRGRVFKK